MGGAAHVRKETDYATWRSLTAMLALPLFWGLEILVVGRLRGRRPWQSSPSRCRSPGPRVPLLGRRRPPPDRLRFGALALVRAHAARRLTTDRQAIIEELEQAKNGIPRRNEGELF